MLNHKTIPYIVSSLLMLSPALNAQTQDITVYFGSLYGANRENDPTYVVEGDGIFAPGTELLWFCLDPWATNPGDTEDYTFNYTVSTDMMSINSEYWDYFPNEIKGEILTAAQNIFYNNLDAILADFDYFYSYQFSLWYMSNAYEGGVWSGTLDADAINEIIYWNNNGPEGEAPPEIVSLLETALIPATGPQFYWATPTDDSSLQSVAFVVVPEPSSLLLVGACGSFFFLRRRRA